MFRKPNIYGQVVTLNLMNFFLIMRGSGGGRKSLLYQRNFQTF